MLEKADLEEIVQTLAEIAKALRGIEHTLDCILSRS